MSAAVDTMAWTGQVPWHGEGVQVPDLMSWQEALTLAGLDWGVRTDPMMVMHPDGTTTQQADRVAIVRDKDNAILGTSGNRYKPVQNKDLFATFGELFQGTDAQIETAGSLHGGKLVWGLARMRSADFVVGRGDKHATYMMASGWHDGLHSARVRPVETRVVCANTYATAVSEEAAVEVRIVHAGDVERKLTAAARTIQTALGMVQTHQHELEVLLDTPMRQSVAADFLSEILNVESAQGQRAAKQIEYLTRNGAGNDPYQGTAYAWWQGVTDYYDHHATLRGVAATRMASAIVGSAARAKAKALGVLFDVTGATRPTAE